MVKYLVKGDMDWFNDESVTEISRKKDSVDIDIDSGIDESSEQEFVEMIGNIIYCETGNFDFTASMVYIMASKFGLLSLLNYDIPELKECFDDEFAYIV